ncbi:TIGR00282 family metallophosphoesterase [Candidatus Poribacteria bacterium]|nr:TIGR00282 family metallophosphoesterase [Candidatus Poribacteria bacterium]
MISPNSGHKIPDLEQDAESSESDVLNLKSPFRILFFGDVVGRPGRSAVRIILPSLKDEFKPDLILANGENLAGGLGLTRETADDLFSYGIDFLTTGNHVWDKRTAIDYINSEERIIRPANYPEGAPGRGYKILDGMPVGIFNLSGRIFMEALDNPFTVAKNIVNILKDKCKVILLDFHAEATSEKIAMGWYLDGKVSAVIGTHTHVQTADEIILPEGSAYITDVGMTGPAVSVIGTKKDLIIQKFLTQMPVRFDVAKGKVRVCAVIIDIDTKTSKAISIQRLQRIVER